MLVKLVLIAVVMVIISLIALRFSRANSVERSISWHRQRLGSIREIVERSAEQNTRGVDHPQAEPHETIPTPSVPIDREAINAHAEIGITDDQRVNKEGRLVFGDLSITPVKPPVPPIYERRPKRPAKTGGGEHFRIPGERAKGVIPLVAAVVLLLVVIGGGVIYYIHTHPRTGAPAIPTTSTTIRTSPPVTTNTGSNTQAAKTQLVSSTASSATYSAPSGSYRIKVDATGPCWIGFERQATGTKWLAMSTIGKSGVNSYSLSTSGHLVIVIGNPPNLKAITLNGTIIPLPKLPNYGYDVIFK